MQRPRQIVRDEREQQNLHQLRSIIKKSYSKRESNEQTICESDAQYAKMFHYISMFLQRISEYYFEVQNKFM